ncbi:MAG: MmcQ/YjbR family DNA-binding protein [Alphaproteobacteria bacterium]|nr:MmcQ/YjbR family DNA-binding protein [Alphaproteobacteria bacterium]MBV9372810.1 MmcQ/YjbR family DNA-binding protein [Alphaproteobacteria bacterium]MBV9900495.1 MmcQ/YjbR family DNA-binding protein [Alphaproteobacteria bacterium]
MPTPEDFRRIALSFEGAEEKAHMGHPDFRVRGKIFATLGAPDAAWGMVSLMPEQQSDFMSLSKAFTPASGAWGRGGSTLVRLAEVPEGVLEHALAAAWRRRAGTAPRGAH